MRLPTLLPTAKPNPEHGETEWQFDVADLRPVQRWLVSHATDLSIEVVPEPINDLLDIYYDTDDWRFYRAGFGLRLRRKGDHNEAALKSLAPAVDGLRQRREVVEAVEPNGVGALLRTPGPVGQRVRAVAGLHPVRAAFEVRTRRRTFGLLLAGARIGEVALDETTLITGPAGETARLCRVEVEAMSPAVLPVLRPFVAALRSECALEPAMQSKYDAGLRASGLQPPDVLHFGPTAIHPEMSLGEVALAVLRRHFAAFVGREPGTRLGEEPEELHQMRVASRRLRAAMGLFGEALPARAARLRRELGWVATALGEVRDLDVQLDRVAAWQAEADAPSQAAFGPLAELLRGRRDKARKRLLRVLDSQRYAAFVRAYGEMLRDAAPRRGGPASDLPVVGAAPELIERLCRKLRKGGDGLSEKSPASGYHALRIRGKRLRYALEFLSDIYGRPAKRMARRVAALQELLGTHQDLYVAMAYLHDLSTVRGRRLPAETLFILGQLAQRCEQQAGDLRARFAHIYRRTSGKAWTRLRRAMAVAMPTVPDSKGTHP